MYCTNCGNELAESHSFCTACGKCLSQSASDEAAEPRTVVDDLVEIDDNGDEQAKFIYRFALPNGIQAALYFMATAWFLTNPVVWTVQQHEYGALYQTRSFGLIYPVISVAFALAFTAVTVGILKRKHRVWYLSVGLNLITLFIALRPPPVWLLAVIPALGLYWAYRSYHPIHALPETGKLLPTSAPAHSEVLPAAARSDGGHETVAGPSPPSKGSIGGSILWMTIVSLVLFWLPALGPLIAGYVGGKKAGSVSRGILAAILPAVVVGGIIWIVVSSLNLPVIGAALGGVISLILIAHSFGLIIGAIIGGALS